MRRMTRLGCGVVLLLLGIATHAQAQISPFKGRGPKLQTSDFALMDAAATPLFTDASVSPGTARSWNNEKTGAGGAL